MKLAKIIVLASLGAFAAASASAAPLVAPATKSTADSAIVQIAAKKKVAKKVAKKKVAKKKRIVKAKKARKVAKVRRKAKSCGAYMYRKGGKCMDARAKKA